MLKESIKAVVMTDDEKVYHTIGIMSGTSLDGLDMALCSFKILGRKWHYKIVKALTIPYNREWRLKLSKASALSALDLIELDHSYGKWIADQCSDFLKNIDKKVDLIASHGHTIFHQPDKGYSLQIGNGNDIAARTGIPVVYDFRSLDVALGGKGAPLVPVGDEYLFSEFDCCLNLGGFSNVSYRYNNHRLAFDICPVNIILNNIAEKEGFLYDDKGIIGEKGKIIEELLKRLNALSFYKLPPPRTLMREWLEKEFLPQIESYSNSADLLRTIYEHIADQISSVLKNCKGGKILLTGGGTKNTFLVSLIKKKCENWQKFYIPDPVIIDFKEALIFGFLGLLRFLDRVNCFASVTGANKDCSTGIITGRFS